MASQLAAINTNLEDGRFWVRIPDHLKAAYRWRQRNEAAQGFRARSLFIAGIYVFLSAGIYQLMPEAERLEWLSLYGWVGAIILMLALLTTVSRWHHWFPVYAGVGSAGAIAISIMASGLAESAVANQLTHAAIMYAVFIIYALVGLSFLTATLAAWCGGLIGILGTLAAYGVLHWEVLLRSYVGSSLIAMMIAYTLDMSHRRNFLQAAALSLNVERTAEYASQMTELSFRDPLTGLSNRRHFEQSINLIWQRNQRDQRPVALIMIDIDHFKIFNDTYGHGEGDQCLKQVAAVIDNAAGRPGDLAARLGGEEFLLVLPDADTEGAVKVAESIRQSVWSIGIPMPDDEVVTVSLGVAAATPSHRMEPTTLINQADEALYQAKRNNRNQTQVFSV
ncbi:GGDEF domain-containing protein [Tamilnaduibacter salinus]|nr:GGDEF domain-containing protein [Tamilnaduibacter salinus]